MFNDQDLIMISYDLPNVQGLFGFFWRSKYWRHEGESGVEGVKLPTVEILISEVDHTRLFDVALSHLRLI